MTAELYADLARIGRSIDGIERALQDGEHGDTSAVDNAVAEIEETAAEFLDTVEGVLREGEGALRPATEERLIELREALEKNTPDGRAAVSDEVFL